MSDKHNFPFADDLSETLAEAFRRLARGVGDRRSAFHTPTFATVAGLSAGTPRPALRTVVLRAFDERARLVTLHTDIRSAKVADLTGCAAAALHVYDAKLQLRMSGEAQVSTGDGPAAAAWARTGPSGRMTYAVNPAPGTATAEPIAAPLEVEAGATNFAIIQFRFHTLEWLWLASTGHRRALFVWNTFEPDVRASWLVP